MIYLELFLGFLQVGCFAFGGAYAAIPLIRDVVLSYGWLSEEMLADMIAVSESTPGPVTVNLATYVGSSQGGLLGAIVATFAIVLPAFVILLLIVAVFKNLLKYPVTQALLRALIPCVIGIILATGLWMIWRTAFGTPTAFSPDWKSAGLTLVLAVLWFGGKAALKKAGKKAPSPLWLLLTAALSGVVLWGVM